MKNMIENTRRFLSAHWFGLLFSLLVFLALGVRLTLLTSTPPSPYWEEVALGYDAYSILKTGKDHHGNFFPVVAFESFGDWKPSLYFYAVVPFIALFGLTVEAVRLPSVVAGVMIVIGVGVLIKQLTKSNRLQLLGMFLASLNPWAVMFSRGGWEVNLSSCLILWAVILMRAAVEFGQETVVVVNSNRSSATEIKSSKKTLALSKNESFAFSSYVQLAAGTVLFGLSMYAYHAARVVAPILWVYLMLEYLFSLKLSPSFSLKKSLIQNLQQKRYLFVGLTALFLSLVTPILLASRSPVLQQRFAQTSIFTDISIIEKSNRLIEQSGHTLVSRLIFHRYVLFAKEITANFFSHFRLDFLFLSGDSNLRHSTGYFGLFYPLDLVFLFFGLVVVIKNFSRKYLLLSFWLFIGILPSAISFGSPHALRILITLPVWLVVSTVGASSLVNVVLKSASQLQASVSRNVLFTTFNLKKLLMPSFGMKIVTIGLLVLSVLTQFGLFWSYYTTIYTKQAAVAWWQYGYQELFSKLEAIDQDYSSETQFVARSQGRPAMYYWFYSKIDPIVVQKNDKINYHDQGELLSMTFPKRMVFFNSIDEITKGVVAVSPAMFEKVSNKFESVRVLESVKGPQNEEIWKILLVK